MWSRVARSGPSCTAQHAVQPQQRRRSARKRLGHHVPLPAAAAARLPEAAADRPRVAAAAGVPPTPPQAEGNAAFSAGRFAEAVDKFTEAIALQPDNHVLYSNRSAAHASLHQYEPALQDARKTVELKADWAKGFSRLGAAHYGLQQWDEAVEAYTKGGWRRAGCPAVAPLAPCIAVQPLPRLSSPAAALLPPHTHRPEQACSWTPPMRS